MSGLNVQGDMGGIIDSVMCASVLDDEERFRTLIQSWIASGLRLHYDVSSMVR